MVKSEKKFSLLARQSVVILGPVVQSAVRLTKSLVDNLFSRTVFTISMYKIFFTKKLRGTFAIAKATHKMAAFIHILLLKI